MRKIVLDAGLSCPNRDGTISKNGCIFCDPKGAGTGLAKQGLDLYTQWQNSKTQMLKKEPDNIFWAYLQSYSNTHTSPENLQNIIAQLKALPDMQGICIATRPDCLDKQKLDILANTRVKEFWLELGLQSANNKTLQRINRGHDVQSFVQATRQAAARNIKICVHLIAGLPGENTKDFINSVKFISALPIDAVKFHNLYLVKDTPLAKTWQKKQFCLIKKDQYLKALSLALPILPQHIIVQRIIADPDKKMLLAPKWATDKNSFIHHLNLMLKQKQIWQGCALNKKKIKPFWFHCPLSDGP